MQTQTHFLLTAALVRPLKRRGLSVHTQSILVGSILPDIPFTLLTLVYGIYYLWIAPLSPDPTPLQVMEHLHFDLFFRDPVWIVAHNLFHAPLVLTAIGGLGIWLGRQGNRWAQLLIWFALGAGLHTVIDITTHTSDGPLLFFPLNWSYRYPSPVSYWEGSTGRFFALLEWVLDGVLILYFALDWWRRRRREETA